MANATPASAAANWKTGMGNSTAKLTAGINAVSVSPTSKAAMAVDRMVAGVQRAAAEGKIQAGLNRVSLQDWKAAMLTKGVPRVAAGAAAAVPKVQNFFNQFLPFIDNIVQGLPARADLETNINRATATMRGAATFKFQK